MTWHRACTVEDILPAGGVAALFGDRQVALIRPGGNDTVHALGNHDPFSKANVISRGIVGDVGGTPVIASPMYKQHFRLADGVCVEDPSVALPVYRVRVEHGDVFVEI
jgi:NAD(P)H-dependent nitrite reductase small subunit